MLIYKIYLIRVGFFLRKVSYLFIFFKKVYFFFKEINAMQPIAQLISNIYTILINITFLITSILSANQTKEKTIKYGSFIMFSTEIRKLN